MARGGMEKNSKAGTKVEDTFILLAARQHDDDASLSGSAVASRGSRGVERCSRNIFFTEQSQLLTMRAAAAADDGSPRRATERRMRNVEGAGGAASSKAWAFVVVAGVLCAASGMPGADGTSAFMPPFRLPTAPNLIVIPPPLPSNNRLSRRTLAHTTAKVDACACVQSVVENDEILHDPLFPVLLNECPLRFRPHPLFTMDCTKAL